MSLCKYRLYKYANTYKHSKTIKHQPMDNQQEPDEQDLPSYKKEQLEKIQAEEQRRKQRRIELAENKELQDYLKSFHPNLF